MIINFHFNKNTMLYLLPIIFVVLALTFSVNAQKEIDPTRQMDPVKSLLAQSNKDGKAAQGEIDVIDDAGARLRLNLNIKRKTVNEQDVERVISLMAQIP